jgi:methionine-rich copper-binding protein CopC
MLAHAEPAVGATVRGPVTVVRLRFTERVEPALCRVTLVHDGRETALTHLETDHDTRVLVAFIPDALAPGLYSVRWRAVSLDAHTTEGGYDFTLAPDGS